MKNYSLLIILSLLFFSACEEELPVMYETPENLIRGFSFESRENDFRSSNGAQGSFSTGWTDEDSFDGSGCLKISASSETHPDFGFWTYRLYEPEPNTQISFRVRAKTKNLEGEGLGLSGYFRDFDDVIPTDGTYRAFTEFVDDEWSTLTLDIAPTIPEGVEVLDLYLIMSDNTKGTAYFDKLEIYRR